MLAVDAETQLPDDLLLLTDKMSMAVSLECRVPLLDHELVELAARMPEERQDPGGRLKHVMKAALDGLLPRDILERKKRGFGTPMGAWLKRRARAAAARAAVRQSGRARAACSDTRRCAQLIADHEANRVDGTDRLLALLNLEIWARLYLDRRDARATSAAELKAIARMKILYVCHRFPFPPKRGGKIRPFNMIRHLADRTTR